MEQIIKHTRGDTFKKTVLFKKDLVVMDLTGSVVKFSIKACVNDEDYILTQTGTIDNPTDGTVDFMFTSTQMKLDLKTYFYDIQLTDSLGTVTTPLKGQFIISYDVT